MEEYRDRIVFRDLQGDKTIFETEPNTLNNKQMYWFSTSPAMYAGTIKETKDLAKYIRKNMELVRSETSCQN